MTDEELIAELRRLSPVYRHGGSVRDKLAGALMAEAAGRLEGRTAALELHRPIVRRQGWPPTCKYDNHRWPCPEMAAISPAPDGAQ